MEPRTLRQLPQYLLLIAANALPVYGAFTGKLVFFQVLWLYWLESLMLIGFDLVRIAFARGTDGGAPTEIYLNGTLQRLSGVEHITPGSRLSMMFGTALIRVLILGFYLIFLVVFVGFQVTADSQILAIARSMSFMDPFVNTSLAIFAVNAIVQLCGGFFLNGQYLRVSPRMYTGVFNARTIIMHVMIVSSVFIHMHLFKDKPYAWLGESVYVGLFMLIRTILDIWNIRNTQTEQTEPVPMI